MKIYPLSERQTEIALLVANGYSNKKIASLLTISHATVQNHIGNITRKLKLDNDPWGEYSSRVLVARYILENPSNTANGDG